MKINAILIKCRHLYAWASNRHINYMVMMSKFFSIFQNCEYWSWFEGKFKKKNCNLEPFLSNQGVRILKVGRLCLCNSHKQQFILRQSCLIPLHLNHIYYVLDASMIMFCTPHYTIWSITFFFSQQWIIHGRP